MSMRGGTKSIPALAAGVINLCAFCRRIATHDIGRLDEVLHCFRSPVRGKCGEAVENLGDVPNWLWGERPLEPRQDFGVDTAPIVNCGMGQLRLQSWSQSQIVSRVVTLRHPLTYGRKRIASKWCQVGRNVPRMCHRQGNAAATRLSGLTACKDDVPIERQ